MLLRWCNGGDRLKVNISYLPSWKSSIHHICMQYVDEIIIFGQHKLKNFNVTHRSQTLWLEEIGQQLQFFLNVRRLNLIGWFVQSMPQ